MSWVKVDDGAPEHRKLLAAGAAACWLWMCGLAYCNRQKAKDGIIPKSKVKLLYPGVGTKDARKLVDVGLWEELETGDFLIHDYHDYQPDAGEAAALSETRAAAGRVGGQHSAEARAKQKAEQEAEARAKQLAEQLAAEQGSKEPSKTAKQSSTPSRPDPDLTTTTPTPPSAGGGGGRPGEIPCPTDLCLTGDQAATLETAGIKRYAIIESTTRFVASASADPTDKRTLVVWRKCLSKAISGDWNDSSRRPKPPEPETKQAEEVRWL